MALTIDAIEATESNEELLELLTDELQRVLPAEVQEDRERFHAALGTLPRGLRAMAGMHFFSVSMEIDDLAWHFGNQNEERDLTETLNGLRELELTEIASLFEKAWKLLEPHFEALRSERVNGENFYDWLEEIGVAVHFEPMNEAIWDASEKAGEYGLLEAWPVYARKYPDRCVATLPLRILQG
jgi:hypothetical protein